MFSYVYFLYNFEIISARNRHMRHIHMRVTDLKSSSLITFSP